MAPSPFANNLSVRWIVVDGFWGVNPSSTRARTETAFVPGCEEGGAAAIKQTAARFRKDPNSWTQQQGKAGAISGQTIEFQSSKLDQLTHSALRRRWVSPFPDVLSRPTQ